MNFMKDINLCIDYIQSCFSHYDVLLEKRRKLKNSM